MNVSVDTSSPDRLSSLLERFRVQAALFHSGPLCGRHVFEPQPGRAFLHILRQGEMEVRHPGGDIALPRLKIDTPSLLLYPQPLHHVFFNAPLDGRISPAPRWTSMAARAIRSCSRCHR